MANIRSSLAFVLVWVNLIVTSLNTYFSVKAMKYLDNNPPYNYKLRGTKEKSTKTNSYYFLEKEIETQKKLRNLSPKKLRLAILIINCFGFYFVFQLSVSFGLEPAEDCDSCCPSCDNCNCPCKCNCDCNCNCDCCNNCNCNCDCCNNCNFGSGGSQDCNCGEGAIILLPIVLAIGILVGLYFAITGCGKHIARIVALVLLFAIDIVLISMSLYAGFDLNCILIAGFSSFAAICNFSATVLPNFDCCAILTFDYVRLAPTEVKPIINEPKKEEAFYEKPYYEKPNYPLPEKSAVELTNNPNTPDYENKNKGNENINGSVNGFDTPYPEYQQTNNNDNYQGNITYPTPD